MLDGCRKEEEEWHETVGRYFDFFEKHLEKIVNIN